MSFPSSSSSSTGSLARHREQNAVRRRREVELIRQLERLTVHDRERRGNPRSALIRADVGRVGVLQDSIDLISRLEAHNAALSAALQAQEDQQAPASTGKQPPSSQPLDTSDPFPPLLPPASSSSPSASSASTHLLARLPPRVSEHLAQLASHHSLASQALTDARIRLLLVDADTGIGLDANESYFHHMRFTQYQLTHTCVTAPITAILHADRGHYPPETVNEARAKETSGDALLVAQGVAQYPRSVLAIRELLEGRASTVTAVWRCRSGDAKVWEQTWVSWVAKTDWVVNDAGQAVQRPVQIVYAAGLDEAILIDDVR